MSQPRQTASLPIVAFARHLRRDPDPAALCIVGVIALFSACVLSLPVSLQARVAAMQRFHLVGWDYGVWALFQPVPSMYNFENRWDVAFAGRVPSQTDGPCELLFHGYINHHIFSRVLLRRAEIEQCGLPADVRFSTAYRGTVVESRFTLVAGSPSHGFTVLRQPR